LPAKGLIEVDDVNFLEIMESWRSATGYVPQFIFLTDDAILRNITFGLPDQDIDDERIEQII
jgi:ABC-type multidrug transport system fused ATPase/permease subunit